MIRTRSSARSLGLLAVVVTMSLSACHRPTAGQATLATIRTESLVWEGRERTFRVYVPTSAGAVGAMPLVIALHGGGGTGETLRSLTLGGLESLANGEGFVVVYPDAVAGTWNDGRSAQERGAPKSLGIVDDVGFISALIDHLAADSTVDRSRVYATGVSNGAMMAYRLACDLSGEIAAIAPVAGSIPEPLLASCWPSRPVSVVAINGVDDPLVPWQGGPVHIGRWERGNVLSVAETIAFWVDHDRCSLRPVITYAPDSDPLDGTRVRREAYEDCQGGAEVVLYAVEGGGHTWPGGRQYLPEPIVGRTSRDADANQLIWAFFMAHRMR